MPKSSDRTLEELPMPAALGRRLRGALVLVVAFALALGATACGSDDGDGGPSADTAQQEPLGKDAYLKQVNAAQSDFAADAAKLNLANPSSPKGFAKSLDQLGGLVDTLRRRLADIAPPEAVTAEQDELVQQLRDYGAAVKREKGDLSSGDPEKVKAAAEAIGKASTTFSQDFDATIRQINDNLGLETTTAPAG
jgi:cytochrome c556